MLNVTPQVAAPGAESAVYDCLVVCVFCAAWLVVAVTLSCKPHAL